MNSTLRPGTPLRPLGLGEVLDRAVSLTVRSFVVLALIYLVIAIPLGIASYFVNASYGAMIAAFLHGMQTHQTGAEILETLPTGASPTGWTAFAVAAQVFIAPLVGAALISATATNYFGGKATFRDAYRVGVARWPQLLLLTLVWLAALVIAYIAVVIVLVIIGFGIAALVVAFKTAGIVVAVIAGAGALLAVIAIAILGYLAYQISTVALVVENVSFFDAFLAGFRRVVSGVGIRRSLLIGLIFGLVTFALSVATATGTVVLIAMVHSTLLGTLYATVLRIVAQTFTTAFVTIYYFDLRVREDGLDLELAAAPATTAALTV